MTARNSSMTGPWRRLRCSPWTRSARTLVSVLLFTLRSLVRMLPSVFSYSYPIGFYTWWLVIASVIGIIATLYGIGQSYSYVDLLEEDFFF